MHFLINTHIALAVCQKWQKRMKLLFSNLELRKSFFEDIDETQELITVIENARCDVTTGIVSNVFHSNVFERVRFLPYWEMMPELRTTWGQTFHKLLRKLRTWKRAKAVTRGPFHQYFMTSFCASRFMHDLSDFLTFFKEF